MTPKIPPQLRGYRWLTWLALLVLLTGAMLIIRSRLERVHVALLYLLLVQVGSARGGRTVGISLSLAAFLVFNWFFLPPYGTLVIADPRDWLVLGSFLVTSLISARMLYLANEQARLARERSEQEERARVLQESQRAKDAVLAAVSHDLRTPLTTIKGLAHEIASAGDERAEVIEEEADRLTTLVSNVLDLSRVTSGAAVVDVQINEAEDLLGAAVQQVQGRLAGRELRVAAEGGDAMLFGRFDFSQTLRALVNLIENAIKFSAVGTTVEVTARRVGGSLSFMVSDRGPGVAAEEVERIFDPFYRSAAARGGGAGTGLGLSIAKGIAEAQGGGVTYAARPGGGSVFTLSVPAVSAAAFTKSL